MNHFIDDVHPLDIRTSAELRDPAMVDLQPFRVAVHKERIEREDAAIQRKHERMRESCSVSRQVQHQRRTHTTLKRLNGISAMVLA